MNTRPASDAEALVSGSAPTAVGPLSAIVTPIDVVLKNGIAATTLAEGDLVVLDTSVVDTTTGDYSTVIAPTVALNLAAAGGFHLVAQETIATGTRGRFRLRGDTKINLNANSGANALISSRGTNKDCSTTMVTLTKVLGLTKVTGTGVKRCYFDGYPPGLAIAP